MVSQKWCQGQFKRYADRPQIVADTFSFLPVPFLTGLRKWRPCASSTRANPLRHDEAPPYAMRHTSARNRSRTSPRNRRPAGAWGASRSSPCVMLRARFPVTLSARLRGISSGANRPAGEWPPWTDQGDGFHPASRATRKAA